MNFKKLGLLALLAMLLPAFGCSSGSGEDVVFIHVANGYAGGGAVTIYGPDGEIVSGLGFNETSGAVAVNRTNYDGNLQFALEGLPGLVEKQFDLYALYPGEHATLFIQRRSGLTNMEVSILRHNLITSDPAGPAAANCAFEVTNNMSLTNSFSDERYEIMTEWNLDEANYSVYYDRTLEQSVITKCGVLQLNSLPGVGSSIVARRNGQLDIVDASPWFFPVSPTDDNEPDPTFRWGLYEDSGGVILGLRSTREYRECVAGAIQFQQNGMPVECGKDANGAPTIPVDGMGRPIAEVDQMLIDDCFRDQEFTGYPIVPGPNSSQIFYYKREASCNQTFRFRTHSVDSVFNAPEQTGKLVRHTVEMPKASWSHVVLYGRPVTPLIYSFYASSEPDENGETNAEDFTQYAYPDGTVDPQ